MYLIWITKTFDKNYQAKRREKLKKDTKAKLSAKISSRVFFNSFMTEAIISIKCVTNLQHNTPDKTVVMIMLTWQKNFTSVHSVFAILWQHLQLNKISWKKKKFILILNFWWVSDYQTKIISEQSLYWVTFHYIPQCYFFFTVISFNQENVSQSKKKNSKYNIGIDYTMKKISKYKVQKRCVVLKLHRGSFPSSQ